MNEKNTLLIKNSLWLTPLRSISIISLFLAAYTLAKGIIFIFFESKSPDISMFLVVLFLFIIIFDGLAAFFLTFGINRIATERPGDKFVLYGYAMLILASILNMIYMTIGNSDGVVRVYILAFIEIVSFWIGFLYYQGILSSWTNKIASLLLLACTGLELFEIILYFSSEASFDVLGHYFTQNVLDVLIALELVLMSFGIFKGVNQGMRETR